MQPTMPRSHHCSGQPVREGLGPNRALPSLRALAGLWVLTDSSATYRQGYSRPAWQYYL